MTVESTPSLPPLAARLRGVQSSPVREILALTERPGMISFAGGLPAPELFDATGLAAAFAEALAGARLPVARCSTRRPRATRRCGPRSPRG
jgi:DNA-binding transcriptional MocR family regulator